MFEIKCRAHGANAAVIQRGFTLLEVLVSLVIAMLLMTAMAGIFQQSISTRTQVDREGQRLESSRFSLDTLTADIRLAGYYGPLTIPSGSIDWVYADPCTEGEGWSAIDGVAVRKVPFSIYGYEAHSASITAVPGCISVANKSVYRPDTDILVVRRVSTTPIEPKDIIGTGWHLQHSACADTSKDRVPFIASNDAATFTLLATDVAETPPKVCSKVALAYRLITRIYFISECDDCSGGGTGDGIPTLKVVEVGAGDPRTVATGVEDMHFEYGIDQTTSGDGAVDSYVVSNNNPRQDSLATGAAAGVLVTGMICHNPKVDPETTTCDTLSENRWEDVMAVRVSLVVRDLTEYDGKVATRSFTLGTAGPVTLTYTDKYRRKLSVTTVSAVNLAARREQ